MKPAVHTTFAERIGRTLGRVWRGFVRLDRKAHGRLVALGWAPGMAGAALLVLKLVLLGVLVYTAFWLALLLAFVAFAAWTARNSEGDETEEWAIGEQAEHKHNPGYDPILYNDAPDPRFDKD
ncbi:DUF3742 family protein [Denitromonas ohlonensis]|uniref:DUF3742 family protein n=2 Tax=Denitromonas TaxID=139331 RepID=A0A558CD97_9RHOO|nr:DUF3742 family protein [Denitromonas ohlonensis]TVT46758.1 MAG: DUF3742 family protein [Denitromonas halophila]TVO64202.1 DUF3742 family protein [Denitromonas ohlonensis]TVO76103.1 DUF3742 family protein [Denitromonas ohlonensis]TVT66353.1 MAG: DUF3742 family protein [Denitromonas halophila]TVT77491.1 MAG: DUF3742 family protein [Denitromonas halophila]